MTLFKGWIEIFSSRAQFSQQIQGFGWTSGLSQPTALPLPPGVAPSTLSSFPPPLSSPKPHTLLRLGHALPSAGSCTYLAARETGLTEIPLPLCWVSSLHGASSWCAQRSAEAQQQQGPHTWEEEEVRKNQIFRF